MDTERRYRMILRDGSVAFEGTAAECWDWDHAHGHELPHDGGLTWSRREIPQNEILERFVVNVTKIGLVAWIACLLIWTAVLAK